MTQQVIWPGGAVVPVKSKVLHSPTIYTPTPNGWELNKPVPPK